MSTFKTKAEEAARETAIIDRWGAATSTCPQSFAQGAEWGYRQAKEELDELTAKYNFAMGSARQNAKERDTIADIAVESLRKCAAPYFIDSRTHVTTIERYQTLARTALEKLQAILGDAE